MPPTALPWAIEDLALKKKSLQPAKEHSAAKVEDTLSCGPSKAVLKVLSTLGKQTLRGMKYHVKPGLGIGSISDFDFFIVRRKNHVTQASVAESMRTHE